MQKSLNCEEKKPSKGKTNGKTTKISVIYKIPFS